MIWVKLPELQQDTEQAHFSAYCWSCQREDFRPGMFLKSQLYLNPFVHSEPICEDCARHIDPSFDKGSKVEVTNGVLHIDYSGYERECRCVSAEKGFHQLHSREIVRACCHQCAVASYELHNGNTAGAAKLIGGDH